VVNKLKTIGRSTAARIMLVILLLCILSGAGWLWIQLTPGDPDKIAEEAKSALERGDVNTLIALSWPKEREVLNLQPRNVAAFLEDCIWMHGKTKYKMERTDAVTNTGINYRLTNAGSQDDGLRYPVYLQVMHYPSLFGRQKCYLQLGLTLNSLAFCVPTETGETVDIRTGARKYAELTAKHNIYGYWTHDSGFVYTRKYKSEHPNAEAHP
jgi:hypothetical protein